VVLVVWDDSTPRLFVVPTGTRPLGLLFRAKKGQVDFEGATGATRQGLSCLNISMFDQGISFLLGGL
jgi:hypothetical protein